MEKISDKKVKSEEENLKRIIREAISEAIGKSYDSVQDIDISSNIVSGFIDPGEFDFLTYDYLIDRNEGLPEEYFKPTNIRYKPNEFALSDSSCGKEMGASLHEGLIKTYPTLKTIEHVCDTLTKKGYPLTPNNFKINNPNDDKSIYGHIGIAISMNYLNKEIDKILKDDFNLCGYNLGATFNRIDTYGNPCVVYQFEPKFQTEQTNPTLARYLFHITTENAAKKIMKQGICPSNRGNGEFNYDARCYFFTVYDENTFKNFMKKAGKENRIGPNFSNYNFKIITIDRHKCDDVQFYTDPNFSNNIAVFTYDNVPPFAIIGCEDL